MIAAFTSRLWLRLTTIISLLACFLFLLAPTYSQARQSTIGNTQCQKLIVKDISLASGQPANNTIYGELCNPRTGHANTVQLLIHGSTYSHQYWDWPNTPGHNNWSTRYSAVRYFNAAGYSTFNIDTIGVGKSSHPASTKIDIDSNSYVIHQLVSKLRQGGIGGKSFRHVILVGHSLGSTIATVEVATYHDVDGVVLTGSLHSRSNSKIATGTISANQDPSGRFANLDPGYQTSAPGTRGDVFYYKNGSDPKVIAYDEQTKDTRTATEMIQLGQYVTSTISKQINVPVLEIVGQNDALYCGSEAAECSSNSKLLNQEATFFSPQAHLQVQVIPNTGHDLNLHYTAPLTYLSIIKWSLAHVRP